MFKTKTEKNDQMEDVKTAKRMACNTQKSRFKYGPLNWEDIFFWPQSILFFYFLLVSYLEA